MNVMNWFKAKKNAVAEGKKGFTLIELVIVILVIGILFVFLTPQLSSMVNKAKTAGVEQDFREYQIAAETVAYEQSGFDGFEDEAGRTAALNANLDAVNQIAADGSTNEDPWDNAYTYSYDADANAVTFVSLGADGVAGTEDVNDDLSTTVTYTEGSVIVTTEGFSLNAEAPAADEGEGA